MLHIILLDSMPKIGDRYFFINLFKYLFLRHARKDRHFRNAADTYLVDGMTDEWNFNYKRTLFVQSLIKHHKRDPFYPSYTPPPSPTPDYTVPSLHHYSHSYPDFVVSGAGQTWQAPYVTCVE